MNWKYEVYNVREFKLLVQTFVALVNLKFLTKNYSFTAIIETCLHSESEYEFEREQCFQLSEFNSVESLKKL